MAQLCAICNKATGVDDFIPCDSCDVPLHYACRGIPRSSNGKPAAALLNMLEMAWVRILCNSCTKSVSGPASPDNEDMKDLKATVASLADSFAAQQAQLAKFLGQDSSKPKRTGEGKAPSSFSALVTSAVSSAGEEEKRMRSIVADGVPAEPGVSDLERVEELLSFLDLSLTIRVQEVFRIGKGNENAPPKLMIVLYTKEMQKCLVSKEMRAKLREPACPPSFANAFINPSRSADDNRLLMLLRHRRDFLNKSIQTPDEEGWFVDYSRRVLVKRVGGVPDWRGPGDPGFPQWAEEHSKTLLARASTSDKPSSTKPSAKPSSTKPPANPSSATPSSAIPPSTSDVVPPTTRQNTAVKTLTLPIPANTTNNTKGN